MSTKLFHHVSALAILVYVIMLIRAIEDGFANSCLWTSVEVNVGTVCACLPVLRPFIQKVLGGLLGFSRFSKYQISKYGIQTSHKSTGRSSNEIKSGASTALFRKLNEDVITLPPKAGVHATSITGGIEADEYGTTGGHTKSIPLNAIYVQRNVDLTNRPLGG